MAPMFSVLSPRRIPLATVRPNPNLLNSSLLSSDGRYTPYARELITHFILKTCLKPAVPKPAAFSPVRRSALSGVDFSLPYRVGHFELQKSWSNEVDWFEAVDLTSGERVLCKVFQAGDPRGVEVALAEARLAGNGCVNAVKETVRHGLPVKPPSDQGVSTDVPPTTVACNFHFYPYLDYRSCLHTYVQAKKVLPEEQARQLFRQICDIVRASHQAGVALRDLKMKHLVWKPNSIESGSLMLSSLHNCTVLDTNGVDEIPCENQASPSYVSPEMCGRTSLDKSLSLYKVDIWCVGVILYAMLCGRYPFHEPDSQRFLLRVAAADLGPLPSHFSPELKALLPMLLHVDPKQRLDITSILNHPWLTTAALSSEPARTVPNRG